MTLFGAMIVSPNPELRVRLLSILGGMFACDMAIGVDDALETLRLRKEYGDTTRVIFVDIDLPESAGNETLARIREWEESNPAAGGPNMQIIVFGSSEKRILKAFFHGADSGHLLPIDADKLRRQIEVLDILH